MLGDIEMSKLVIVLGTNHDLQGAERRNGNVKDPMYESLLKQLIVGEKLDFIFEEATGFGPTIAEKLSLATWGPKRYLDVDPPRDQREQFGIPKDSNDFYMIGSPPEAAFACWQFHEVHSRREELWVQRMTKQPFKRALMICGHAHTLSFAFRLRDANMDAKAITYARSERDNFKRAHTRPVFLIEE
jgi:hypothetical protein